MGILVVAARFYSRGFITKALGFDDILILIGLCFGIALSVLVMIGNVVWFDGRHVWDIPIGKAPGHRKNIWASEWCYTASLSLVKISVLLFYRRLSVTFSRAFLIAVWAGIVYNILYIIGFGLGLILLCNPIEAYWMQLSPAWEKTHHYSCGAEGDYLPAAGAFSVLGDFYSALLPMLLIMHLDLPRRQKISLYCLFALAFLVVGAGIARTVLLNVILNRDYDFTWVLWEMWIWGLVELYVGIFAASAPSLKPFFRRFLVEPVASKLDSSSKRRQGRSKHGYAEYEPDRKGWSLKSSSNRGSAMVMPDPERIGVAYGGSDATDPSKSREESFVREVDDNGLETRHFELRTSRDGKIIPMQVWKNKMSSSTYSAEPLPHMSKYDQRRSPDQQPGQSHVRNFSQPHSHTTSGDTSTPIIKQPSRRKGNGQGSVSAGRERATEQLQTTNDATLKATRTHPNRNQNIHHLQEQPIPQGYLTMPLPAAPKRQARSNYDTNSSLDAADIASLDESYRFEQVPYNDLLSASAGTSRDGNKSHSHSRSRSRGGSAETLGLPRMGSRDDFREFGEGLKRTDSREREREFRERWKIPGDGGVG